MPTLRSGLLQATGLFSLLGQGLSAPRPLTRASSPPWTNPIVDGWYADPDGIKFGDTYWMYATVSTAFGNQTGFDAFSSKDLAEWTVHKDVFSVNDATWATGSLWAPCTIERDGKYWFYYTANDPTQNEGNAGVGVGVADSPGGPFLDATDTPLIARPMQGANAMDTQVYIDSDGHFYLLWGGTRSLIQPLNDDMISLGTWPDGSSDPIDITPNEGFVEGSFMLKRSGTYYFMWSEGGYGEPDYRAAYAMSESLTGPFERIGLILSKDDVVADGPGHHSVFKDDDGEYYIAYHRRIIGDDAPDHRVVAIDNFEFNEDGTIRPVVMT